ncbi:MAG: hypothetical protein AB7K09_16340, partial [Planctomycetota bacterium]
MSIRVICYCSKETLVPESFCGEHLTCSNCAQHYVLPGRWRTLGRPLLDIDLRDDELVTIQCECGNAMEVPVRHAGRRIACEDCGAQHGVPRYQIPESNAAGQDIEAVRTSINMQAAAEAEAGHAYDDYDDGDRGVPHALPARSHSDDYGDLDDDDAEYEGEDAGLDAAGDDRAVMTCRRCKLEFYSMEPFCPECGAHPNTGLTHPEAQEVWARYQRGERRGASANRTGSHSRTGHRTGTGSLGKTRAGSGSATQRNRPVAGGTSDGQAGSGTRKPAAGAGSGTGAGGSGSGNPGAAGSPGA